MPTRAGKRTQQLRQSVAVEAARLMLEQGIRDFGQAKQKAADRLGLRDERALPRNAEVEEALRQHQRLFEGPEQAALLASLRREALEAMGFFARFEPRLVGAVLDGTADRHSAVCLHLFCDDLVEVEDFLVDRGIPFETQSRRLRTQREQWQEFPVYLFAAGGTPIDITVFPLDAVRQAPIDRSGERPMARASLATVERLVEASVVSRD
jgi:hypothetical protein